MSLRANVLGFAPHELRICVEPHRLIILGRRKPSVSNNSSDQNYTGSFPDLIMRVVDLPVEVLPEASVAELEEALLEIELPKAAQATGATAGQGS